MKKVMFLSMTLVALLYSGVVNAQCRNCPNQITVSNTSVYYTSNCINVRMLIDFELNGFTQTQTTSFENIAFGTSENLFISLPQGANIISRKIMFQTDLGYLTYELVGTAGSDQFSTTNSTVKFCNDVPQGSGNGTLLNVSHVNNNLTFKVTGTVGR